MPGIGGRLGWNEPPPAAITTILHSNTLPPSVPGVTFVMVRMEVDYMKELRSEEHTSELQSRPHLVCRLLLEKKKAGTNCRAAQSHSQRGCRHSVGYSRRGSESPGICARSYACL